MELVPTIMFLVVAGAGVLVVYGSDLPGRLRRVRTDAELAGLIDLATVELVQEQLDVAPQLVVARTGCRLHGPFLDIETKAVRLHLRLYRDADSPSRSESDPIACLTGLTAVDGQGWVATFDGPLGPQRYLGWLVQSST